ncbi:Zn-dependent hydrolase [Streptomyces sp. NPDC091972]|uniref:Zn-dependent hydrolase n=1 Tax=Streptomyces sp. NPDC091972 TaxID=3366007 RepID=UPI0037FDBD4D
MMALLDSPLRAGPIHVDGDRLTDRLGQLRTFGGTTDGGVTRPAFTPDDLRARETTAGYLREAGLRVRVDEAANLIGTAPGRRPELGALVLGSHLDTVRGGGAYDGAYGVMAAVEVVQSLRDRRVELEHPLAVIAFANEEGTPDTSPMFGSRAVAGLVDERELNARTADGRPFSETLDAAGGDSARIGRARWPHGSIAAFLEAHIEQGPILEREGARIGVVEGISGRQTVELVVRGAAGHGGTTPMDARRDALVAAAQAVLGVRELAGPSGVVRVATVGQCRVVPGAWNVIPGEARLQIDLRDLDGAAIDEGLARLRALSDRIAADTGTTITLSPQQRVTPTRCDERLRKLAADAADSLGHAHRSLPSGAGHDAQWMSRVAPSGMVFVPSRGGVSHVPEEYTAPEDLVAGADVLLNVVLAGDREFRPEG